MLPVAVKVVGAEKPVDTEEFACARGSSDGARSTERFGRSRFNQGEDAEGLQDLSGQDFIADGVEVTTIGIEGMSGPEFVELLSLLKQGRSDINV